VSRRTCVGITEVKCYTVPILILQEHQEQPIWSILISLELTHLIHIPLDRPDYLADLLLQYNLLTFLQYNLVTVQVQ